MAAQRRVKTEYRYLKSKVASSSLVEPSNMVARLCERAASIEKNAMSKMTKRAKEVFNKEKYIRQTSQLEEWEVTIMAAIVFDVVPWTEQDELIPGTRNTHATFQEMDKFFNERNYSWMRRAIASFIFKEYKQSYLAEAAGHISIAAHADIQALRREADKRIDTINDELREMGYDQKGNKL